MNDEQNKAYNEGLDSQTNGVDLDGNLYPAENPLSEFWVIGWQQGADEDFE